MIGRGLGLRLCHVQRQTARDDQRRYRNDLSRFHVNPFVISAPAEVI